MSEQPPVATAVLDPTLASAGNVIDARKQLYEIQEQKRAEFDQAAVDAQFNAQVAPLQQAAEQTAQSDFAQWEAQMQTPGTAVEPARASAPVIAPGTVPAIPQQPLPAKFDQLAPAAPQQELVPAIPERQPVPLTPEQPVAPAIEAQPAVPELVAASTGQSTPELSPAGTQPEDGESTPKPPETSAEAFDTSKLTIGVVDVSSGVESHARDAAAERLDRETTQPGIIKGLWKKVIKGNVARDYIQLKYQREAKEQILADGGNLYAAQGGNREDHAKAAKAVVDRFVGSFVSGDSELLASNENELGSLKDVGRVEKGESEGSKLETQLRDAIGNFAEGKMGLADLEEAKKIFLKGFGSVVGAEDRKKGLLFADNIVEVAVNAKAAFDHGLGVANVEERLARIKDMIRVGHSDAQIGVRSEARQNVAEKAVDWIYRHKSTAWLNETTVGAAVGVGMAAANITAKSVVGTLGKAFAFGAGSAVIAGAREYNQITKDRVNHMRSMAEGGESVLRTGKRRERIDETRYETRSVSELMGNLEAGINGVGEGTIGVRRAVDLLTHIRARVEKSDTDSIDLISFSSKESVETERRDLMLKMAEARVAIKKQMTSLSDADLEKAGMVTKDGVVTRDVSTLLRERTSTALATLEMGENGINARDQAFRKLRVTQSLKMAAAGYATGLTVGIATQEVRAALSDSMQGVLETRDGSNSRTLLASIFHRDGDGVEASTSKIVGDNIQPVDGHTAVNVPDGYSLKSENGAWNLSDSLGNKVVDNVGFGEDGKFSDATQQELAAKGFNIDAQPQTVAGAEPGFTPEVTTTTVTSSPEDYIANHKNDFTSVSRQDWYNNGSDAPDHNENDIWWGGKNNTGIDENGNYRLSVAHMTSDGSWSQGTSADAEQLVADGKMKMAISVNENNVSKTIMVDIDKNGDAIIDKDSFAGRDLFKVEDVTVYDDDGVPHIEQHAKFIGGYAEAVQLGEVHDGVQDVNVLATVEGDNTVDSVQDTVTEIAPTPDTHSVMVNTLTKIDTVAATEGLDIDVPPVVPLIPRSGLERTERQPRPETEPTPEPPPVQPQATSNPPVPVQPTPVVPSGPQPQRPIAEIAPEEIIDAELVDEESKAPAIEPELEVLDGEVVEDEQVQVAPPPQPQIAQPRPELTSAEGSNRPSAGMGRLESLRNWAQAEPNRLHSRREVKDSQGNSSWVEADGSPVTRNVDREHLAITDYMERLIQKDPEYARGVEGVVAGMGPMSSATRVAINVPVVNSSTNLATLLPQYVTQTDDEGNLLAPGSYEVNVLVSRQAGTQPNGTMDTIRQFMADFEKANGYPAPINAYEVEIDAQDHTEGYVRKLLNDVVVSRSAARTQQDDPLYIATETDLSITRVDKQLAYNAREMFDINPQFDAISGAIDRTSSRVANNDMQLIHRWADDYLGTLASQKQLRNTKVPEWDGVWNDIPTHDANTVFTAEAYALVDGDQATDVDGGASLGERIAMIRGDGQTPNLDVIGRVATRSDAETFNIPADETLARIEQGNEDVFLNFLRYEAERVKQATPNQTAANQLTRRLMFSLGFQRDDYDLDGELSVHNWDNVRTKLSTYRRRHSSGVSLT